jgi:hypothetical protein
MLQKRPNAGLANPAFHTPNAIELMNSYSLTLYPISGFLLALPFEATSFRARNLQDNPRQRTRQTPLLYSRQVKYPKPKIREAKC